MHEATDEDDTAGLGEDGAELAVKNLQHSSQVWASLVATIGHLMAFHKCCWQMLAWTGVNGKLVPRSSDDTNGSIHLQDHRGVSSKIKYKHHDKPNVGLGFSLTPLGEQTFEFEKRLGQARACAVAISTASMSVTETWLAFVTRVLPKVTYPFMLT